MKSYTDLEQSKKLAEILPIESADMRYGYIAPYEFSDRLYDGGYDEVPYPKDFMKKNQNFSENEYDGEIPCWSLSALLDILDSELDGENGTTYQLHLYKAGTWWDITYDEVYDEACPIEVAAGEELVDVCVAMIIELHKLNMI